RRRHAGPRSRTASLHLRESRSRTRNRGRAAVQRALEGRPQTKKQTPMSPIADLIPTGAERLDAFHDLLPTLARALDVRDVFRHLSEVADRIVPHDEANLALVTEDGSRFRLFASTADGPPELLCREDRCMLRDLSQPRMFTPGA